MMFALCSRFTQSIFGGCFRFLTAVGLALSFGGTHVVAKERINVLLICVDDLKPALGCYGDTFAKTPQIDRFAERATRFEAAYCNQAVCSPSRNALLTGLRPQTLGIYDLATNFRKARPNAVTLPEHFKAHGWRAEALGKIFHVGHGNRNDAQSWSVPHWTSKVISYALPESKAPKGLTREEALFENQSAKDLPRGAAYEAADVADTLYPDGALASEAIVRLQAAAGRPDQPFFLAVGFAKPHLPFVAPQRHWNLYQRDQLPLAPFQQSPIGAPKYAPQFGGELRQYKDIPESGPLPEELQRTLIHGYYAATSYVDAQIGRLLTEFERLGLAKNTVVVLWGDHGWHLGDHGMWCKHSNYEQAARIPLLIATPNQTQSHRATGLIETVDLYPTLCQLAGVPVPDQLDGISQEPQLAPAATPAAVRDHVIHVYPRQNRLGRAIRTSRYRYVEWKPFRGNDAVEHELYDYDTDPLERENLAAKQPAVVAELAQILSRHPQPVAPIKP